jgi:hypothetical protein
LGEQ